MTNYAADFVSVHTQGGITASDVRYARKQVGAALRFAHDPVLHVRVNLELLPDPAVVRRGIVQANLDLNGRLVRAEAARDTVREAVDEVHDRLRDQLQRAAQNWEAIRGRSLPSR